jgi:hypothetical protein
MSGIAAPYEIRRIAPKTKINLFSIHEGPKSSATTRILAADDFVPKTDAARLLAGDKTSPAAGHRNCGLASLLGVIKAAKTIRHEISAPHPGLRK